MSLLGRLVRGGCRVLLFIHSHSVAVLLIATALWTASAVMSLRSGDYIMAVISLFFVAIHIGWLAAHRAATVEQVQRGDTRDGRVSALTADQLEEVEWD